MRRIICCGCCARDSDEVNDDGVSGSYWNVYNSRGQLKQQEHGTLSTIVMTEPSGSATARNSAEDFVDIEFPQGSFEEDRFSDMSATIFKRQHN